MKTHKRLYTFLNLRLFDGEGTGAGGAAPNGGDGAYGASSAKDKASGGSAPKVLYGRQREAEPPSTSEIPKQKNLMYPSPQMQRKHAERSLSA